MQKSTRRIGASAVGVLFFAACQSVAQAPLGISALSGIVYDEQNRSIPGARVLVADSSRNQTREAETDSAGSFAFPALDPGTYALAVSKPGFKTYRYEDLHLEVGQRAVVSVSMSIGETRTVVTVTATANLMDPNSNGIGSVVDSERVRDLPLNGRNFLQLGLLAGGAADISTANDNVAAQVGHSARMIVLPGAMPYSVGYYLDGLPVRGARVGELALNLSIAAVDQFKVQEGFLMPDQWANPGSVDIVSKSGTNSFHGEAFEFIRNRSLDARSFFAVAPEDLKRNQFGFALGGPVIRDRVWFHAFYEGLREVSAFSSAGYAPTAEMFHGNFKGRSIFDPSSYDAETGTRTPFPDNVIPANRFNPVATRLLAYYSPGSSLTSAPSNVFGTPRNTLNDDQGGIRVDISASHRQQVFGQVMKQNSPAEYGGLFPLSGLLYDNQATLAMLVDSWTVNPRTVNSLRAGFF